MKKKSLELRKVSDNLDKCRRLRNDVQHEESREFPDLKYLADLKAEVYKYSGSITPQEHGKLP